MNIKKSNLTIGVADMDRSISFYLSIGFSLKQRWNNHYAQLSAPDLIIGLHPTSEATEIGGKRHLSIGFTTDDFIETRNELRQLGIAITERTEEGGNFIHFNDPDGTALYFIDPKK